MLVRQRLNLLQYKLLVMLHTLEILMGREEMLLIPQVMEQEDCG
jgi:hypothetical protein